MNIPKVGQKYICVAYGWSDIFPNDVVEVCDVTSYDDACFVSFKHKYGTITWDVYNYPNDFKLVEFTTEHGTFNVKEIYVKPPLGLQSWQAHDSLRVQDILAAMQRYVAANKAVPNEWLEELIDKLDIDHEQ